MSQSLFAQFQPLAAIATTLQAAQTLQPLCQTIGASLWVPASLSHLTGVSVYEGSLKAHLASLWSQQRGLIFGLATGAVVRLIAPLLTDKASDPAIVVLDEQGQYAIALCGAHQGGAEQLTRLIAHQLGATPILTGAAANLQLPGIDMLGVPFGWHRGDGDWTAVSAAVARSETVQVIQQAGSTLWKNSLRDGHPFVFRVEEDREGSPAARIWISAMQRRFPHTANSPQVQWHPRVLWVGIGCERGTPQALIAGAIAQTCQRYHLAEGAIAGIATLDRKADEVGLLELCQQRHFPLKTFPPEQLRAIAVPTPSSVVAAEVGTPSVAEAAALLAAMEASSYLSSPAKVQGDEETANPSPLLANDLPSLLVPKQIFKSSQGAVTVAIAQSAVEYTGREGQLWLVGIGPGSLAQMTPAAKGAIAQADAVIGYSLYLDLIAPLQRPGQLVEAFPITQERQRAQRAIALADWGLSVAVVSSGDAGIYGMAGLVLEELYERGWNGKTPQVEVFPGITAMQAASARIGAPLMHDFCAISLSDLLTPWEAIEKRLAAAAQADFITALYNPRSRTRIQPLARAQQIFLDCRDPNTPVAIARAVYRQEEQIVLTTLEKMLQVPIDMLTTVIIGNRSTRRFADWMLTPRGYLGFEEPSDTPGSQNPPRLS